MTSATPHFTNITAVVGALKTQLAAVMLADGTTPAFQRIEIFDNENLVEAFQQLLVSEQRTAVIVPLSARWEEELRVRKLLTRRVLPVAILVSDRVLGHRREALFGNASAQGAYALAALAVPAVSGQLLHNPNGVVSAPKSEDVLVLKPQDKQNLPGRAVVVVEIECRGGWLEAPLDAGITL